MTKGCHLCKPPTCEDAWKRRQSTGLGSIRTGSPRRAITSMLVTRPPTRIGSETESRQKAYGNLCSSRARRMYTRSPKQSHAKRRMETSPSMVNPNTSTVVRNRVTPKGVWKLAEGLVLLPAPVESETESRQKAYGNVSWRCCRQSGTLSPKQSHAKRRTETYRPW
jgi:hypothetical protein